MGQPPLTIVDPAGERGAGGESSGGATGGKAHGGVC